MSPGRLRLCLPPHIQAGLFDPSSFMQSNPPTSLFHAHPRDFEANRFVYPVLSRRAGGISIGINLNPEKSCTFNCVYCQVDRTGQCGAALVPGDLPQLADELQRMLDLVLSGEIFELEKGDSPHLPERPGGCCAQMGTVPFFRSNVPEAFRRLNDIALSGDGEPTASPLLADVVELCVAARRKRSLEGLKIVLITNGSLLDREPVRRVLEVLDVNHGEVWIKLDAGTEAYYRKVSRSGVGFQRILDNLRETARERPIVVQTLFFRLSGQPPPVEEQDAYCDRLGEVVAAGGQIALVQIHTIARPPAEAFAEPLSRDEVDAVAERVRRRTGLRVAAFYGA